MAKRVPELDGVRGLAILLVVLYHYVAVPIPANASAGYLFVRQVFSKGWSGVDLFFVLSGFLIAGILIDHRAAANYYAVFYIRRVSRIFPLYYFLLALFLALQAGQPHWRWFSANLLANALPLAPYFLYLQNFAMAARGGFGNEFLAMTWSLAVEEQFYLFLPWLVRRSSPQSLPLNALFLIGLPTILRLTLGGDGQYYGFVLAPWRLDSLFMGVLLAVIIRAPNVFDVLKNHRRWGQWLWVGLLILVGYWSMTETLGALNHFFVFGLFYALTIFLALAEPGGWFARVTRHPALTQLGLIAYGVYIFHQLVNGLLHDLVFKMPPRLYNFPTLFITLLAFSFTCLLAWCSYHFFEKRFIAWGHNFRYADS